MFPEFQLREEHFVVIELDSHTIKAGPANPMAPPGYVITSGCLKSAEDGGADVYGSQLGQLLEGGQVQPEQLQYAIKDDCIADWDLLESVLNHVITAEMKIKKSRNHSPTLLSIPSHWSRSDRELLVKMFFEKFNCPGLYIADRPLMSLYGYGQHLTGLVIEFNHDRLDIVPIVDTVVQHSAATHLPMGYGFLCGYLRELLEKDTQFKREYQGPVDDALVRFLMEEVCEVSPTPIEATDPSKGRKEKEIQRVTITFNGQQFTVGDARFKVYEALFVPPHSLGLKYTRSLTESMLYSTLAVDGDRRIQLLDNIVLAGHYCKIKGLKQRMEKDIKRFLSITDFANEIQPKDIKFGRMPEYIEAIKGNVQDAAWLGSSVVAKLVFPDMKNYITKLDYNECGPNVVNMKGY